MNYNEFLKGINDELFYFDENLWIRNELDNLAKPIISQCLMFYVGKSLSTSDEMQVDVLLITSKAITDITLSQTRVTSSTASISNLTTIQWFPEKDKCSLHLHVSDLTALSYRGNEQQIDQLRKCYLLICNILRDGGLNA